MSVRFVLKAARAEISVAVGRPTDKASYHFERAVIKPAKIHSFSQRKSEMSPYVLAAAGVLLAFIYVVAINHRGSSKLPPSPPSLPLLGHLHLIGRLPHRSLHELHLRYGGDGGGLLLLQLGRRRSLVASTAAAAADLFRNHDLAFASRPRSAAGDRLMYGCRNVSFAPYGGPWRRARRIAVAHLLSPRRVESFAPVRAAEAAALVARARRAAEAREPVELRDLLYGYANSVVTRAATGAAGAAAERLRRLMGGSASLVAGFQAEDMLPDAAARAVRWATGLEKRLDDMAGEWDTFLSEIVAAHREKGPCGTGEEEEDFVDVLLRLQEEGADASDLTDDRIKSIVMDMIAAATETSTATLEWAMATLFSNPRVMTKLQDEIARAVVADSDQPAATIPQEEQLDRMGYLKAVLKEVLRLHPPVPLLVPHKSTANAVVQGYEIPAETALFVNAWAIGRDPAAWDAPEEFRPERFVGGGGPAVVDFRGTDYQLIPFGAGRRVCPGIGFALPVVELALASLLHHFEWTLPAGMRPADLDMGEAPGLTTLLRVPLVLVPKCRTNA